MGLLRADYYWLVDEIAKDVGVSDASARLAKEVLRDARRFRITGGRSPSALAAAALYIACVFRCEQVTQSRLARSVGVSEVALRFNYKRLLRRLNACLPVKFVDFYRQWRVDERFSWTAQWRKDWEKAFFDESEDSKGKGKTETA